MKAICNLQVRNWPGKEAKEQGVLTATGGFRVGEEMSQVMYSQATMWRTQEKKLKGQRFGWFKYMINCESDGWRVKFRPRDRCCVLKESLEHEESFREDSAQSALSDEQKQRSLTFVLIFQGELSFPLKSNQKWTKEQEDWDSREEQPSVDTSRPNTPHQGNLHQITFYFISIQLQRAPTRYTESRWA